MPRFRSMVLRVSREDRVVYANEAFCQYVARPRGEIEGCSIGSLANMTTGEVAKCFASLHEHAQPNALVTDSEGRVFEVKTARELGALDIVLDEVTHGEALGEILRSCSGIPLEDLDEEELRTLRNPDLRFVTVCRARLQTEGKTTGALSPMDHRILTNAFIEELSEALISKGCTILPSRASGVVGLSGAPRHHADHALRGLEAAFDQVARAARLQNSLSTEGREMPPIGWAIASGDAVVGTFGGFRSMSYSAEGRCVELAERIAALASPGEVLVTEASLLSLLENLPEGWSSARTVREADPDFTPYASHAGSLQPIDGNNQRGVWIVGPGVAEDWQKAVFVFDYLWNFQSGPIREPVPVLRAVRAGGVVEQIPLSLDRLPSQGYVHRLGKYRLLSVIGHGGMGRVWRAHDIYGNVVAIKTLNTPQADSPESVKRFRREAEVMSRLQHRNICRIFEMNEHEGSHYIVMEFVEGLSLADVLYSGVKSTGGNEDISLLIEAARAAKDFSDAQPEKATAAPAQAGEVPSDPHATLLLTPEQALALFLKVCSAVEYAHNHGVLHRDLKPANILLRCDGEPLVADFGLAKLSSGNAGASLSMSGNVLGTVENMAPEQAASSKSVDARADVYSLGTILYQMVTGKRHFEASGTLLVDIQKLQTHEPPRPRSINPRLDPDLELIILKCLRHEPAHRYRGVAALRADIQRYLKGSPISARPASTLDSLRKLVLRNRAASLIAAGSLAIILLIVTGSVWSLAWQLKVSEQNKRLAEDRLREIQDKEALYSQTLQGRILAEMSEKELRTLVRQKEEQEAAVARQRQENKSAMDAAAKNADAEKSRRKAAEARVEELEKQLAEFARKTASAPTDEAAPEATPLTPPLAAPLPEPEKRAEPPAMNPEDLERALGAIERDFEADFSEENLPRFARAPEKLLDTLNKRIDEAAGLILKAPDSGRAWMLMGHLRLAALEFQYAAQSFEKALTRLGPEKRIGWGASPDSMETWSPGPRREATGSLHPILIGETEIAQQLRDFSSQNAKRKPAFGKEGAALADPLLAHPSLLAQKAGAAMVFFASKPSMAKSLAPITSPMRRDRSNNEIALQLLADNDLTIPPVILGGPLPKDLDIRIEGDAGNLAAILLPQTKALSIHGAQALDRKSLLALPQIARLDFNGSQIQTAPPLPRASSRLVHLGLANTPLPSLQFATQLPNLASLDITNTPVVDLAPLAACKNLRSLEAGGCTLQNLRSLQSLKNLRRLTLSPESIPNPADLESLQETTLTVIRSPRDPADQSAEEFFRKYLKNKTQ
jgi:serine/threonine protein kinase/class 3 adenylate cyclase